MNLKTNHKILYPFPLTQAVERDQIDVVKYLVDEINVNIAKVDIYNKTAKDIAIMLGRQTIKLILEKAEERLNDESSPDIVPTERESRNASPFES